VAAGVVALALLAITGSIVTASGRPDIAIGLVALTLAVGSAVAFTIVPQATPGPEMLRAAAVATAIGMAVGLVAALLYLGRRFSAWPPLPSLVRVCVAVVLGVMLARLLPGNGKLVGLLGCAVSAVVFAASLLLLREFGATDREKFAKILKLRGRH
jgi:hypothetical protein